MIKIGYEQNRKDRKDQAMTKCANCDEEIDDTSFKEGTCGKCGQEIRYGSEGCAG